MRTVKVIVEGNNCLIKKGDVNKKYGFFATRLIFVDDVSKFEEESIRAIRGELDSVLLNNSEDAPRFSVELVKEVEDVDAKQFTGFTWYPEERRESLVKRIFSLFTKERAR